MPSESGENQTAAKQPSLLPTPTSSSVMGGRSDEPPSIPCPRCESTNTKFCYYNNYNLSQPRHFCKSCRRYWTQGGSLRNVPVGGGSRKSSSSAVSSSKRHRSSASSALTTANNYNPANIDSPVASTNTTTSSSSNSAASLSSLPDPPLHLGSSADPCLNSAPEPENCVEFTNLKETRPPVASETEFPIGSGSFISLLNNQSVVGGGGGGYQTGFFPGYYDMGFTLPTNPVAAPRGISWPYYTTPTNPTTADYLGAGDFDGGASTWQQQQQLGDAENANGGGGAYVDAEGFAWPSFVIPSPAKGLMK